ncbi:MAG TPA: type II toxin-antitoxin system Phd/YefM family antitoxin [Allocoleopsis sp.]
MQLVQNLKVTPDFTQIYQQVISDREPVEISINGDESVSVIPTSELNSLLETVYLFQSQANAKRLLESLDRAKNKVNQPETLASLRQKFQLEEQN